MDPAAAAAAAMTTVRSKQQRQRGAHFVGLILCFAFGFVIRNVLKLEHLASNLVQNQNSEIFVSPQVENSFRTSTSTSHQTASIISSKIEAMSMKNTSRSKVHWCFWKPHMGTPMQILQNEFGYTEEVVPQAGDQWDLIFGGYPNCGDGSIRGLTFDWNMKTGLNKYLNEQGWDKLQPHQVWFPCMGCKSSYCNKKDLCLLMKKIDPNYCFSLPDDRDRLLENMRQSQEGTGRLQKQQFWVLKEDYPDKHLHLGNGVHFITSEKELPNKQDQGSGAYLVQPLVNHMMGAGDYQRRRHELRMYVCVTSTTPLRAYTYTVVGRFANAQINDTNPLEPCSVDTHGNQVAHKLGCHVNKTFSETRSFDEFSENINITESDKGIFLSRTNQLIGKILLHAQPKIQNNTINEGITKSGASCFSFLRVDFAMTDALEPYIYEINEFPFANAKGFLGTVQGKAYRELFKMIGLDRVPMAASERSKYEMGHLGGWTPVVVDNVLSN